MGRATSALALTASGSLVVGGLAYADNVRNDVVGENRSRTIAVGTSTTVNYHIQATGGTCDARDGSPVTVTIVAPAAVTPTPRSVQFNDCGEQNAKAVTFSSAQAGSYAVTSTWSDVAGDYNTTPSNFALHVSAPTNTSPTVRVGGVAQDASYNKGSVPAATCEVTDTEDGNSTFPATLSSVTGANASDGVGSQTASCSYTDRGGLTDSASATYGIVDPSAPVVSSVLSPASPDGNDGWYTKDVNLTWTVTEPESPGSLVKTGCASQAITEDQRATSYSCAATSAGGSAAEQRVTIKRDGTAPSVSYDGVVLGTAGTNGWYTSDVTARFSATDAVSGPATAAATVTTSGQGAAVLAGSPVFTDAAGNASEAGAVTRTYKIDKDAPNAPSASLDPAPNGLGWHNSDVTVTFASAGDNGPSGVDTCTAAQSVSVETASQTVSGTCRDNAGNVSAATVVTVKLDKTRPTISETVTVAAPTGNNGWYTEDVEVFFTATDGLSGLSAATRSVMSSGEGEAVPVSSPHFTDRASNTTTAADMVTKRFKIDQSAPTKVAFVGGPSAASSHHFGSVPAAPTCTADDAVSGLASCVVEGYSTAVGAHTMTATATDNAGNTVSVRSSYTVLSWTTAGFYAPVDMGGVLNRVKGGSTVPLKFELFAGSRELDTTASVVGFTTMKVTCETGADEAPVETVTTGGTSLRYDSTAGQFIQNWKVPTTVGCYRATVQTADGSSTSAEFKVVK